MPLPKTKGEEQGLTMGEPRPRSCMEREVPRSCMEREVPRSCMEREVEP